MIILRFELYLLHTILSAPAGGPIALPESNKMLLQMEYAHRHKLRALTDITLVKATCQMPDYFSEQKKPEKFSIYWLTGHRGLNMSVLTSDLSIHPTCPSTNRILGPLLWRKDIRAII